MIPASEQDLHEEIKSKLLEKRRSKEVFIRENISSYDFDDYMEKWYGELGFKSQEIDLLVVMNNHDLWGIEVKYFQPKDGRTLNQSFHAGISQAVALSLFTHRISLHHYFHPNIDTEDISWIANQMNQLERSLDLPFKYESFSLKEEDGFLPLKIHPASSREQGELLGPSDSFDVYWGNPNPLLDDPTMKKQVEKSIDFVKTALEVPSV